MGNWLKWMAASRFRASGKVVQFIHFSERQLDIKQIHMPLRLCG